MALVGFFFTFLSVNGAFADLNHCASVFGINLLQLDKTIILLKMKNMKTKLSILTVGLLLVCLVSTANKKGTSLLSGQSLTELGQYTIQVSEKALNMGGEDLKTYQLNYSNCDSPVFIGVKKTKKCMNFIVHTTNFEVEYICRKHVFGVRRISGEYQTVNADVINEMMNNAQFYTQRVISQYPKTETELLGLIACYFPTLIKDRYLERM